MFKSALSTCGVWRSGEYLLLSVLLGISLEILSLDVCFRAFILAWLSRLMYGAIHLMLFFWQDHPNLAISLFSFLSFYPSLPSSPPSGCPVRGPSGKARTKTQRQQSPDGEHSYWVLFAMASRSRMGILHRIFTREHILPHPLPNLLLLTPFPRRPFIRDSGSGTGSFSLNGWIRHTLWGRNFMPSGIHPLDWRWLHGLKHAAGNEVLDVTRKISGRWVKWAELENGLCSGHSFSGQYLKPLASSHGIASW